VGDHLPENRFDCTRDLLGVDGFELTIKFGTRRVGKLGKFREQPGKVAAQTVPFLSFHRWRKQETFGIVLRVCGLLATDALEFVAHPVIHVENELGDGVRKAGNLPGRDIGRNVFDAGKWIDMSAASAEEFSEGLGHFRRSFQFFFRPSGAGSALFAVIPALRRELHTFAASRPAASASGEVFFFQDPAMVQLVAGDDVAQGTDADRIVIGGAAARPS